VALTAGTVFAQPSPVLPPLPVSPAAAAARPDPLALPADVTPLPPPPAPKVDPAVVQAGCSTCSQGLLYGSINPPTGHGGGGACGCNSCATGCVPGREPGNCCCGCDANTCVGRMLLGLYDCICCPDPCYEPSWQPLANAA